MRHAARRATLPGPDVLRLRFTPDGRYLVVGAPRAGARLWSTKDVATRRGCSAVTPALSRRVDSPDGHTLATGSLDGHDRLCRTCARSRRSARRCPACPTVRWFREFTADGAYLFAFTNAGREYRWDVRPSSWARQACAVAGRTLTRAEWQDALPGRDYAPACSG